MGPRKYCLYSKLIGEICCQHDLLYHYYADDTQVNIAILSKGNWLDVSKKLEACLADINTWMSENMLKLYQEKTVLIIFNPIHKSRRMTEDNQLQVGEKTVCAFNRVSKELGSIL